MNLKSAMIGVTIFVMISVGCATFLSDMSTSYEVSTVWNGSQNASSGSLAGVVNSLSSQSETLLGNASDLPTDDYSSGSGLLRIAWRSIKIMGSNLQNIVGFSGEIFNYVESPEGLNMPVWVRNGMLSIMAGMFVILLIILALRFKA